MAFMAVISGLGLLFYILLGFRYLGRMIVHLISEIAHVRTHQVLGSGISRAFEASECKDYIALEVKDN